MLRTRFVGSGNDTQDCALRIDLECPTPLEIEISPSGSIAIAAKPKKGDLDEPAALHAIATLVQRLTETGISFSVDERKCPEGRIADQIRIPSRD